MKNVSTMIARFGTTVNMQPNAPALEPLVVLIKLSLSMEGARLIDGENDGCCDVEGTSVGTRLGCSDGLIEMEGSTLGICVGV